MKFRMKYVVALLLVLAMTMQFYLPVMADPVDAESIIYEEPALEPIEITEDSFIPEEPAGSDVPESYMVPEDLAEDVPQDSDMQAVIIPEDFTPEADNPEVPDVVDPVDGSQNQPVDEGIVNPPQELAEETETSTQGNDSFDVSEPDPSLLEFYQGSQTENGEGQSVNNSSTRGLNTSNKEPAELKGYNFVLFGLSGHNSGDDDRSDTIMIVNIDPERAEIKLISILRDTKAAIEGHEPQKINAAYKYGGAELALDTINKNFSLNIKEYITVDFQTLEDIVDMVEGIEIELSKDEVDFINTYSSEPVVEGINNLNGEQALLYCRIRKTDSDKVRAGRQQAVIREILTKLKTRGFIDWLKVMIKVAETSEISMSLLEIVQVLMLPISSYQLVNCVIPDNEYEQDVSTMIDEHGEWIWVYDLEAAGERIVDIINNQ